MDGTAPTVAMLTAGLGGRKGRAPWTWSLTVHGPSEFFDVYRQALAEKIRDADAVIAISDFARSQLMALVDEQHWEKIEIVHCGVDPDAFLPREHLIRDSEDPLRILNVARMAPTKGHSILVDALAEMEGHGVQVCATFAGDGPRRQAVEQLIHTRGMETRIQIAGAVGQDDIRTLYAWADVFCLPSFAEGLPVVLMEAMASGLPVIATRIAGVAELVEDGHTGLVISPGRVDELVEALRRLGRDQDLRGEMGRFGREKVIAEFSVDANAKRLLDIFLRRTAACRYQA
jgi:colanic acid/amylovoran biosynthesis glycosyltransferase